MSPARLTYVHCGMARRGYTRIRDNVGYYGIFWDIRGGIFFRKDSPQTEGRRHTHLLIKTSPERAGIEARRRACETVQYDNSAIRTYSGEVRLASSIQLHVQ